MNKSYFSDNEDDQADLLFFLLNNLFDVFSLIKLERLCDILEENKIKALILEIEPTFENLAGTLELSLDDGNFGIRYANIVQILNSFEKYFNNKSKFEKLKYTDKFKIKANINVNDLLKGEQKHLNQFCEIFLLLASISSEKDLYIDRISECEERYLNGFLNIVEKYIIFTDDTSSQNKSANYGRKFTTRTSVLFGYSDTAKTMAAIEKMNKRLEDTENEKRTLLKTINQLEQEIEEYQLKTNSLRNREKDLEGKIIDLEREVDMLKSSNEDNLRAHQDMYQDILKIDQFKKQLLEKDVEIDKIHQDYKNQIRIYLDKISRLEEKIHHLNEKDEVYQNMAAENEKLKAKNKEMSSLKEKLAEYDDLMKKLDKQNMLLDTVNREKSVLQGHVDKLTSEIFAEKEKNRALEFEIDSLKFKIEELQNSNESLKNAYDRKDKQGGSFLKRAQSIFIPDTSEDDEGSNRGTKNLLEIDREQILREIEKAVEERVIHLMQEIEDLRNDKLNSIKSLKEDLFTCNEEKEKLMLKIEEMKFEISELISCKSQILMEKEKIELNSEKNELEYKKNLFNLEKEKDTLDLENAKITNKLNEISKIREGLNKELEDIRIKYNLNLGELERIVSEKQNFASEIEKLKGQYTKEIDRLKEESNKEKDRLLVLLEKEKVEKNNIILKSNSMVNNSGDQISINNSENSTIQGGGKFSNSTLNNNNSKAQNNTQTPNNNNTLFSSQNSFSTQSNNNKNSQINNQQSMNNFPTNPSPTPIIYNNTEQLEPLLKQLHKEFESLKSTQLSKDDTIKHLNDKIKQLETDNKSLTIQLKENLEKYSIEIQQRAEDLEFMKRAYDDQRNKLNREHEMISSSLYDMTMQFMSLKNEMNRKSPKKSPSKSPILVTGGKSNIKTFSLDK